MAFCIRRDGGLIGCWLIIGRFLFRFSDGLAILRLWAFLGRGHGEA